MIKILFVSDRRDKINEFSTIFNKNTYEFSVMTDETLICDIISVDAPDIIIMDYTIPDLKKLNKKIKSVCRKFCYYIYNP